MRSMLIETGEDYLPDQPTDDPSNEADITFQSGGDDANIAAQQGGHDADRGSQQGGNNADRASQQGGDDNEERAWRAEARGRGRGRGRGLRNRRLSGSPQWSTEREYSPQWRHSHSSGIREWKAR